MPRDGWADGELLAPCFQVAVGGTTGSGDCTVAGFLGALLRHHNAYESATRAVAVGAFNVESSDATSGIQPWSSVEQRLKSDWSRRVGSITLTGWEFNEQQGVFSPMDST